MKYLKLKRSHKLLLLMTILICVIIFCYLQNNAIVLTDIKYINSKIPNNFNGYKILHVSDLHNKEFGNNQKNLIKEIKEIKPDIIVITGDLIDSRRTTVNEMDVAISFVKQAIHIAPIYYVSGNHEERSGIYEELKIELEKCGVINLDDNSTIIELNGENINLLGIADISFTPVDYMGNVSQYDFNERLENIRAEVNHDFTILLSHRPELISIYSDHDIDLIFSGHAHGGQVRLPFIPGLIAPDQGFFPKHTSGIHKEGTTSIVISRGLGNSLFPLRVFNRPELVIVTLNNNN
ncbi:metallophosphoesterase [Clostridium sp.]|uniref:metallophosphoesterase n=1 Tax=Clostridium sp. TaxID=1506 RepID=UPI0032162E37